MIAGVILNLQFRVHRLQLQTLGHHRKDATNNNGGACIHCYRPLKYFREAFIHSFCNSPVLACSQRCQISIAVFCQSGKAVYHTERLLSQFGKYSVFIGFAQYFQRLLIVIRINPITRSMTSIMTQIKWLISFRGNSHYEMRFGIGTMVSCRTMNIFKYFLFGCLGTHPQQQATKEG